MVVPIGDLNPTHRTPVLTIALIAVNVGIFVFGQPWAAGPCEQQEFFLQWAAVPDELVTGEPLSAAEVRATVVPGCALAPLSGKPVYLSVLSAMFLHAGWLHLLFNMLYLWIFGNNVEDRLGHLRFLVFYLAAGAVATVGFAVANASSLVTLVGASGAIAGVLGAYLVMFPLARVTVVLPPLFFLPFRLPALLVLGLWFLGQFVTDDAADMSGGGVAYLAHILGFVAGVAGVLLLGERPRRVPRPARRRARRSRRRTGRGPGWTP